MASTSSKVLAGCAVGCLVVLILGAGAGWMGYRWVRETVETVEAVGQTDVELEKVHGPLEDFVPPPVIPADRMEVFLTVRDTLAPDRETLAGPVVTISEAVNGDGGGLRVVRAGMSLSTGTVGFAAARNRALLEHGMGFGEYMWIYWLCYHGWLGHPADDSLLHESLEKLSEEDGRVQMQFDVGAEPERLTWRLRRDVGVMLENLNRSVATHADLSSQAAAIAAELEVLEADPARVPWQDGLPAEFTIGLDGYRDRLEATYSRATNPFELMDFE